MTFSARRAALAGLAFADLLAGCATSPTGRSQFITVSDQQMDQLGASSFEQMKQSDKRSRDARQLATAQCVVDALTLALPPDGQRVPELQAVATKARDGGRCSACRM